MIRKKAKLMSSALCFYISFVLAGCSSMSSSVGNAPVVNAPPGESRAKDSSSASTTAGEGTSSSTATTSGKGTSSSTAATSEKGTSSSTATTADAGNSSSTSTSSDAESTTPEPTPTPVPTETPVPIQVPSVLSEEELLDLYSNEIGMYRCLTESGFDLSRETFDYPGTINGRLISLYKSIDPVISYCFMDLANDGTPELVFGITSEGSDKYELLDIYGNENGTVKRINTNNNADKEDGYFGILDDLRISETNFLEGGMLPQAVVYRLKPNSCEKEIIMQVDTDLQNKLLMYEGESELHEASLDECQAFADEINNLPRFNLSDWTRVVPEDEWRSEAVSLSFAEFHDMMNWTEGDLVDKYSRCAWFQYMGNSRYRAEEMYIEGVLFSVEWWASEYQMISIDCETYDTSLNSQQMIDAISQVLGYDYYSSEEDEYTWVESDKATYFDLHEEPAKLSITAGD